MKSILAFATVLTLISFQQTPVPVVDHKGLEPYLNKQNDTTYIINFWATWCKPCIEELPYFEKINETYKDKKVKVILVSLDFPKQYETRLLPFIEKNKVQSQVILLDDPDSNSWINKVDKNWSGAIPFTIIYNKKNRKYYEKAFTYSELEKAINDIE